jgi:hypothetical protein
MRTHRFSLLSVAAFLMLLCSTCIVSRNATACPYGIGGPTSFTAAPGSSQTLTWTAYSDFGDGGVNVSITDGSGVFTLGPMPKNLYDSATFTITFTPGPNATGTFTATVSCGCREPHQLTGTVAESGVTNPLPVNVTLTVTPNPATDHIDIMSTGVRSSEIVVYDELGKPVASSKTTSWRWDASGVAAGAYIVRIAGESYTGDAFVISRRIFIER